MEVDEVLGRLKHGEKFKRSFLSNLGFFLLMYFFILMAIVMFVVPTRGNPPLFEVDLVPLILILVIAGFLVGLFVIYTNLSSLKFSEPLIYEGGLLVPPLGLGGAFKDEWVRYPTSQIEAVCPEFLMFGKTETKIEFEGFRIRFRDKREHKFKTKWDDPFTSAFVDLLRQSGSHVTLTIEEYHDLKNVDAKKVKELFRSADNLLAGPSTQGLNWSIVIAYIVIGFILAPLLFYFYFGDLLPSSEGCATGLFIIYLLIMIGVPYGYFLSKGMEQLTKVVVLLHLIEMGEGYYSGKVPSKYKNRVDRFLEIANKAERTDLRITAELAGQDIEPLKWAITPKPLEDVPKDVVDVGGEEVEYYNNKLRKNLALFVLFSIVMLVAVSLIISFLRPERFLTTTFTCCIPLLLLGIICGLIMPFLLPKRVGFSSRGIYIEKQPMSFSGTKSQMIPFDEIADISLQRKGGKAGGDKILKKDGEAVSIVMLDNPLQEEMLLRFQMYKDQRPEDEAAVLDKKYYWVSNKQYMLATKIIFAALFLVIVIPAGLIILFETAYIFLFGDIYVDEMVTGLTLLVIINLAITMVLYKREKRMVSTHQLTLPLEKRRDMEKLIDNLFTRMGFYYEKRFRESKIKRFEVMYTLRSMNFDLSLQGHWLNNNLYCIIYTKDKTDEDMMRKIRDEILVEIGKMDGG